LGSAKSTKRTEDDEEPDSMRGVDDRQVLVYQQKVLEHQDQSLDMLSSALERTKHVGIAIGNELEEQSFLLGDLQKDVETTDRVFHFAIH
jgi:hypothetical protein